MRPSTRLVVLGSKFDTDAQAYMRRVEVADNAALEEGVKLAINNFVVGCKVDGIWSAIKASCILAGARTLAGALVPLVGTAPTNFNFVSDDYNRRTGLVGNGSTKYLNTNLAASALPLNSTHLAARITEANTLGDKIFIGTQSFSPGSEIGAYYSINPVFGSRLNSTAGDLSAPANSGMIATFYGISRASSADYIRRYSSASTTISIASTGISTGNYAIFARSVPNAFTNARIAFYSIGESLDLALLDDRVTTLINAYSTAIV